MLRWKPPNKRMLTPDTSERAAILIIDDDEQIVDLLSRLLGDTYDCRTVSSAEDALAVLETGSFALILSDIDMGCISGFDLIPLVHRETPETVVVMISGHQTIETAIEAM